MKNVIEVIECKFNLRIKTINCTVQTVTTHHQAFFAEYDHELSKLLCITGKESMRLFDSRDRWAERDKKYSETCFDLCKCFQMKR